jgi:hypothetical protein
MVVLTTSIIKGLQDFKQIVVTDKAAAEDALHSITDNDPGHSSSSFLLFGLRDRST